MTRRWNRTAGWLALLAIALHAFWPLVAQAKPRSAILVPVCTIDGITHFLELAAGKTPAEERSAAQHDHCTLCVFGADRVAAAPGSGFLLFEPVGSLQSIEPSESSGNKRFFAVSGNPRAPPAAS